MSKRNYRSLVETQEGVIAEQCKRISELQSNLAAANDAMLAAMQARAELEERVNTEHAISDDRREMVADLQHELSCAEHERNQWLDRAMKARAECSRAMAREQALKDEMCGLLDSRAMWRMQAVVLLNSSNRWRSFAIRCNLNRRELMQTRKTHRQLFCKVKDLLSTAWGAGKVGTIRSLMREAVKLMEAQGAD